MLKVKPILVKRKDLKIIELEGFRVSNSRIEASHTIIFKNDEEFTLRSKVVFVWGNWNMKQHTRYPSTFHDIKIGTTFHKSASQEFLINNFHRTQNRIAKNPKGSRNIKELKPFEWLGYTIYIRKLKLGEYSFRVMKDDKYIVKVSKIKVENKTLLKKEIKKKIRFHEKHIQ